MQFRLQNLKWSYFPDHKWVIPAFSLLLLFGVGACSEKKK